MLQEGINEPGAMASWIAAATSYANSNTPMIPFYIYYSMFGFQRVRDLSWAAGDMRARGFLLGGTSGRTTLNGEGLQHEDGHSHILSATIPNCISYDATYSYEVAVIVQNGLKRMYGDDEDVYFYLTLLNENYEHPAMPEGAEEGIVKGMYLLRAAPEDTPKEKKVTLLGSGAILREVIAGAELLEQRFRDPRRHFRRHQLHRAEARGRRVRALEHAASPGRAARSLCHASLAERGDCPVIASTDYIRAYAEQVRAYVPAPLQGSGHGRVRALRLSPRNCANSSRWTAISWRWPR